MGVANLIQCLRSAEEVLYCLFLTIAIPLVEGISAKYYCIIYNRKWGVIYDNQPEHQTLSQPVLLLLLTTLRELWT